MTVHIYSNYISESEIAAIKEFFAPLISSSERDGISTALGYENSKKASSVSETSGAVLNYEGPDEKTNIYIGKLFSSLKNKVDEIYGVESGLVQASYQRMTQGARNGLHSDTLNLDGSPINPDGSPEEFIWSGLLYTTTQGLDFEGGNINFPDHEIYHSPKAGDLIIFEGDLDHLHEVTEVLSGSRENFVLFWGRKGVYSEENRFEHQPKPEES